MGESSYHCGDLIGGFCGAGVESGGLDILKLLYCSSLWFDFYYAMLIMIMSMHTTSLLGRGGGSVNVADKNKL